MLRLERLHVFMWSFGKLESSSTMCLLYPSELHAVCIRQHEWEGHGEMHADFTGHVCNGIHQFFPFALAMNTTVMGPQGRLERVYSHAH